MITMGVVPPPSSSEHIPFDDTPKDPFVPRREKFPPITSSTFTDAISRKLADKVMLGDFYPNDTTGTCAVCGAVNVQTYPIGTHERPRDICRKCLRREINETRLRRIARNG